MIHIHISDSDTSSTAGCSRSLFAHKRNKSMAATSGGATENGIGQQMKAQQNGKTRGNAASAWEQHVSEPTRIWTNALGSHLSDNNLSISFKMQNHCFIVSQWSLFGYFPHILSIYHTKFFLIITLESMLCIIYVHKTITFISDLILLTPFTIVWSPPNFVYINRKKHAGYLFIQAFIFVFASNWIKIYYFEQISRKRCAKFGGDLYCTCWSRSFWKQCENAIEIEPKRNCVPTSAIVRKLRRRWENCIVSLSYDFQEKVSDL